MSFRNKKGVVGTLVTTFVATIVIVFILVAFALGSGVVKALGGSKGGLRVPLKGGVISGDLGDYVVGFVRLVKLRSSFGVMGKKFNEVFESLIPTIKQ